MVVVVSVAKRRPDSLSSIGFRAFHSLVFCSILLCALFFTVDLSSDEAEAVAKHVPTFRLADHLGRERVVLGLDRVSGRPFLRLLDHEGRALIVLEIDERDRPSLEMRDEEGETIWRAP